MISFADTIRRIEAQVVDLTAPSDLFHSSDFRAIYDAPGQYESAAIQFIKRPDISEQQKIIAGLSLHKLPLSGFLKFSEELFGQLKRGEISARVFRSVVFASFDWNTELPCNYDKPEVTKFLKEVIKSELVDANLRKVIEENYLTGQSKLFIESQ